MNLPFVISLGSNVGDRMQQLRDAVAALREVEGVEVTGVSPVYETEPWGRTDQPKFYNAVVTGTSELAPEELLEQMQAIEDQQGRVRDVEWGPRTIDLDLIRMGLERCETDELTLPHPLADERAFVIIPWHDLDPVATEETYPQFADESLTLVGPLEDAE